MKLKLVNDINKRLIRKAETIYLRDILDFGRFDEDDFEEEELYTTDAHVREECFIFYLYKVYSGYGNHFEIIQEIEDLIAFGELSEDEFNDDNVAYGSLIQGKDNTEYAIVYDNCMGKNVNINDVVSALKSHYGNSVKVCTSTEDYVMDQMNSGGINTQLNIIAKNK